MTLVHVGLNLNLNPETTGEQFCDEITCMMMRNNKKSIENLWKVLLWTETEKQTHVVNMRPKLVLTNSNLLQTDLKVVLILFLKSV